MTANMQWHDLVAQNLSGQSSPGYRAQVGGFEEFRIPGSPTPGTGSAQPASAYPMLRASLNRSQGTLQPTGSPTDLGLEGPGFFAVQAPGGGRAFTRDGQFHIDRQGALLTKEGYPVLGDGGPVRVDPQAGPVSFGPRGEVSQAGIPRGQVQLVEVPDPSRLQHLSGSYYRLPANLRTVPASGTSVQPGFLEGANTSSVQEMGHMLLAMRHFEANQRALQVADERMGRSIQELGTPPQ